MMAQKVVLGFGSFGGRGERTAFVGEEVLFDRELREVGACFAANEQAVVVIEGDHVFIHRSFLRRIDTDAHGCFVIFVYR